MTDLNEFKAMLNKFNIEFDESEYEGTMNVVLTALEGGVMGYPGFICVWSFDPADGRFLEVGVWE